MNIKEGNLDIELEKHKKEVLSLSICGLDNDLSRKTRIFCIEAAEELVANIRVFNFLTDSLLSCKVPEEADIESGLQIAIEAGADKIASLYKTMKEERVVK